MTRSLNMTGFTSQEIFKRSVAEARHKKAIKAIENIKKGCDFLEGAEAEITLPAVAAYCADHGIGPKLQSIHNNKNFYNYIAARRAEQNLPLKPTEDEPRIATGNAQVDGYVNGIQMELRHSKKRENLLRVILRRHADEVGGFDMEESLKQGRFVTRKGPSGDAPAWTLPELLVHFLENLIDPKFMEIFSFIQADGCFISPQHNDKTFLSKRVVDCINLVLEEIKNKPTNGA